MKYQGKVTQIVNTSYIFLTLSRNITKKITLKKDACHQVKFDTSDYKINLPIK